MKMKIEIEELDEECVVVMSFPNELEFDTIIEILREGFKEELLYSSHIERKEDCFVISLVTSIEKGKKLSQNIDKLWANLKNRLN